MDKGRIDLETYVRNTNILLYHDIDSIEKPTEKRDVATKETVVGQEEFEGHMKYLADEGYRVISVRQYLDSRHKKDSSDKNIVLTFDDGHISNYEFALPILLKYSFFATFFVIADNIGKQNYMGPREIAALLACDMEIGSHGLTHAYLSELDWKGVNREVSDSKKEIEACIQRPVEVFAYPGGHYNKRVLECVRASGYRAAVSCIVGWNNPGIDMFLLRRIEIRRGTCSTDFKKALTPANILFFRSVDMGKSLLKRAIGLKKYEHLRQKLYFLYPLRR